MRYSRRISADRRFRFILTGLINTLVNFAVLNFAFYGLHRDRFVSIIIATSCAIGVSFILNRSFVFADKSRPARKLVRFAVVSTLGVFIIQNLVYALGILLMDGHEGPIISAVQGPTGYELGKDFVDINFSNILASLAVMIWNYNGYRLFVFNDRGEDAAETAVEEAA